MSEQFRPPVRFPHLLAKVNAFLLIALALVATFGSIVAHKQGWFVKQTMIRIVTPDALGISKGMPVKLYGFTIGSVSDMQLVPGGVDVQLAVMTEHMPRIPKGSKARFARESGVIGASVIEILPGRPINGELAEGEQIDFERSRGISEIVEDFRRQAAPAFAELKNTLSQVNRSSEDLGGLLAALRAEAEELPATHKALRRFIANADRATQDISKQANATLLSAQRASEAIEKTTPVLAGKLATTLDSVDSAVVQLRQAAAEAQETLRGVRPVIDRSESTLRDASEVFSAAKRVWPLSDSFKDPADATLPIDSFEGQAAPGPVRP
ncbi:MAG TPA: MlaD family protein [Burkholderiales bacterium]|jgi:phospholipid/cholesterol/gamma-HCH transport system substrate-binding protein